WRGRKPEEVRRNWEGKKGMKRMKKKVVAMVTLAMFVMSMLPMAAFAAPVKSEVSVNKDSEEITIDATSGEATATIDLAFSDADKAKDVPAYVWLTKDDSNKIYRYATYKNVSNNGSNGELKDAAKLSFDKVDSQKTLTVELSEAGVYTLHAGLAYAQGDFTDRGELGELDATGTITVTDAEKVVTDITVDPTEINYNNGNQPNGTLFVDVTATVTSKYVDETGNAVSSEDEVVTIENSNQGIDVVDADDINTVVSEMKADENGQVAVKIVADENAKKGTYPIYFKAGDKEAKLQVKILGGGSDAVEAESIEQVEGTAKVVNVSETDTVKDVVKFVVKDADGNELKCSDLKPADFNVVTLTYPKQGKANFAIGADADDNVVLVYDNGTLKEGEYVVRVGLSTGAYVDATFTVAKYDNKPVSMEIVMNDSDVENSGEVVLEGESSTPTGTYIAKAVYVDKNGVQKTVDLDNASMMIGHYGEAVQDVQNNKNDTFTLQTKTVDKDDETKYIGSKITLTVVDTNKKFTAKKELTVVDPEKTVGTTLEFDQTEGKVNKNNTVKATVVDEDGNAVKIPGNAKAKAYVESKSVDTARVSVSVSPTVKDGVATLTVKSDAPCTADIVVAVQDGNGVLYANTLKYTFGEQEVTADTSVVMTLGSTEMLVNNEIVDMKDAAPFAKDNRTFVPFRALGEALGAKVEYVEADKAVTYKLGGTEIVMTLDSKTYTVNGAEKTMDVAPFAKDNRTYVPVRFVGEALGFKVTGLQDGNGKYVGVAFTK
ncbi:MAG: copper amine oxidase N-terminal domain-containing protein, partial [Peptococcaceae bacterium]